MFGKLWREGALILRYSSAGVINTVVGLAIILSAIALGLSPELANVLGYGVGLVLSFFLSKRLVFDSQGKIGKEAIMFLGAFLLAFGVNMLVLRGLTVLGFHVVIAQLAATASYTVTMYVASRLFVFSHVDLMRADGD